MQLAINYNKQYIWDYIQVHLHYVHINSNLYCTFYLATHVYNNQLVYSLFFLIHYNIINLYIHPFSLIRMLLMYIPDWITFSYMYIYT